MKNIYKKQLSYLQIYLIVIFVVILRVSAEWALFDFPIQLNIVQDYIRFFLENTYYFLIVFTVSAIFVSKLIKKHLRTVMNFGVRFYPVIILPPLIDGWFLGRTDGYYYATIPNLAGNFFTLSFLKGDATLGISIEILLALVGLCFYVWKHSRSVFKSLMAFVFVDFLLVLISTPDLLFGSNRGDYFFDYFLPLYYYFPFLIVVSSVLYVQQKNKFLAIVRNIRLVRSGVFVCAVVSGGFVHNILVNEFYMWNVFMASWAVFWVWQVSVIVNDISDLPIDRISNLTRPLVRQDVTASEYRDCAVLFSFFALSFSSVVSWKALLGVVVALILAYVYSAEPFRLRKNVSGNFLIGFSLLLCFLIGNESASFMFSKKKINFIYDLGVLSIMVFLFGAVISLAKDIKDVEADKKHGIKNLFTIFGKEKGKLITLILIFLVYNIPTTLSQYIRFFVLSLIAVVGYQKYESIRFVYLVGVIIFFLTIFT